MDEPRATIQTKSERERQILYIYIVHTRAKSLQLCMSLCDAMGCSSTGSSVRGILLARILEWVCHLLLWYMHMHMYLRQMVLMNLFAAKQ